MHGLIRNFKPYTGNYKKIQGFWEDSHCNTIPRHLLIMRTVKSLEHTSMIKEEKWKVLRAPKNPKNTTGILTHFLTNLENILNLTAIMIQILNDPKNSAQSQNLPYIQMLNRIPQITWRHLTTTLTLY